MDYSWYYRGIAVLSWGYYKLSLYWSSSNIPRPHTKPRPQPVKINLIPNQNPNPWKVVWRPRPVCITTHRHTRTHFSLTHTCMQTLKAPPRLWRWMWLRTKQTLWNNVKAISKWFSFFSLFLVVAHWLRISADLVKRHTPEKADKQKKR